MWRMIILLFILTFSVSAAVTLPKGYVRPDNVPATVYDRNKLDNSLNNGTLKDPNADQQDPQIPPKDNLWNSDFN